MDEKKGFVDEGEKGSRPEFNFKTHIVMNILPGLSEARNAVDEDLRSGYKVNPNSLTDYISFIIYLHTTIRTNIVKKTVLSDGDKVKIKILDNININGAYCSLPNLKKLEMFLRRKVFELGMTDMSVQESGSYDGVPK